MPARDGRHQTTLDERGPTTPQADQAVRRFADDRTADVGPLPARYFSCGVRRVLGQSGRSRLIVITRWRAEAKLDRLLACEFTSFQTAYNRIERHAKRPCANTRTVLIAISVER
jgi:hypothetical protein